MVRKASLLLALIVGFAWAGESVAATVPDGPRLAFKRITYLPIPPGGNPVTFESDRSDLVTSGPLGDQLQVVAGDSLENSALVGYGQSWSPDGSTLALGAVNTNAAGLLDYLDIYLVGADGTGLRRITHLGDAENPVFSADGTTIYFDRTNEWRPTARSRKTSLWAIGVDGTGLRRLTPPRRFVTEFPSSVSPTTGELAFSRSRCPERNHSLLPCHLSARLISPNSGAQSLIAGNASDPAFSPDGGQVALVSYRDRNWPGPPGKPASFPGQALSPGRAAELYVRNLATGQMRRLSKTKGLAESAPAWDPSGQRLAYVPENGLKLLQINADGSCRIALFKKQGGAPEYYLPTWQPGPGREAGRISC